MNRLMKSLALVLAAGALLAGCERPPINSVQTGYRGVAMQQELNPRILATQVALNTPTPALEAASPDGPKAKEVYQNVKVLGDLSVGQFARLMTAMTSWVAPEQGCTYCHNAANFADDAKYTKVVARRMVQMTQHINADWQTHVAGAGVTCYTCHRGNPVPQNVWFNAPEQRQATLMTGNKAGQNTPAKTVAYSALPYDPFTPYLQNAADIRVNGTTALPEGNRHSIKQAEHTYGLMMHMSSALGVNCTYCHNTRAFSSWEQSPPTRTKAWYAIRMARDLNADYLTPLTSTFPPERLGATGDVAKINCATCHQGAYKPLYGANMISAHPELASVVKVSMAETVGGVPASEDGIVYFATGSAAMPADIDKALASILAALKANPQAKVTLSGYHSATGDLAANQELAKQRAMGVQEALKAAGVDPARVVLSKPIQTEANAAGEDPKARRVELAVK